MKIGIIIQARMGSSRLPGKVLKKIEGRSLLELQYERLKLSTKSDIIIVATSRSRLDDRIADLCKKLDIHCFRGSEQDVLGRFYEAAKFYDLDLIVRTNADCPFIDASEVDKIIKIFQSHQGYIDYVSNILEESFPLGMHIEVFSNKTLRRAFIESAESDEREHVTPYIYRNPEKFKIISVKNQKDFSHYRWTIDYEEDLNFVREIYRIFGTTNNSFKMNELIHLINKNPELAKINNMHHKKQSLLVSKK